MPSSEFWKKTCTSEFWSHNDFDCLWKTQFFKDNQNHYVIPSLCNVRQWVPVVIKMLFVYQQRGIRIVLIVSYPFPTLSFPLTYRLRKYVYFIVSRKDNAEIRGRYIFILPRFTYFCYVYFRGRYIFILPRFTYFCYVYLSRFLTISSPQWTMYWIRE
jgi:hypothetical protein